MTVFVSATGVLCYDTRDLMRGVSCPHCLNLAIGVARDAGDLKRQLEPFKSPMDERILQAGNEYEAACLSQLEEFLPAGQFVNLDGNNDMQVTLDTLFQKQPIAVAQARLERKIGNTRLNGYADLLVREDFVLLFDEANKLFASPAQPFPAKTSGVLKYRVYDVKLASKGSVNNAMQVALYVDALAQHGLDSESSGGLVLGNHTIQEFATAELVPATMAARDEFVHKLANASFDESDQKFCDDPLDCHLCLYSKLCAQERLLADDLNLVAKLRRRDVLKLRDKSISSMTALASAPDAILEESDTLLRAREQAKLQVQRNKLDDPKRMLTESEVKQLSLQLDSPRLRTLPRPSPNDLFFDFEGYPAFEPNGLEYLFGILENPVDEAGSFHPLWAHDFDQERQALIECMQLFAIKLSDPTAHIYHYGDYEISALRRLTQRHGILVDELSGMLETQRFINLQRVVEQCLLIGAENYSIKSLEPFYGHSRSETEVQTALGSIDAYWLYLRQTATGDEVAAAKNLSEIEDYNFSDCVSTHGLFKWLSSFAGAHEDYDEYLEQLNETLRISDEARQKRIQLTDEQEAIRSKVAARIDVLVENGLVSSESYRIHQTLLHAIDFYPAEARANFVERIVRLNAPVQALEDDPKVLVIRTANLRDEGVTEAAGRTQAFRTYFYEFDAGQSFSVKPDADLQARITSELGLNNASAVKVLDCTESGIRFKQIIRDHEIGRPFDLLFEFTSISTTSKESQVFNQVEAILDSWRDPRQPVPRGLAIADLLARNEPALTEGESLTTVSGQTATARVSSAVSLMQATTLCIQGPPGTGKTYLASRVIKQLIEAGKTVGVTSNSHSAIENLMSGCHEAGIPLNLLIKKPQNADDKRTPEAAGFTLVADKDIATLRQKIAAGHVVGGTSFDFVKTQYLAKPFDYLFIDEAAQFSLVDAIAVSASAKNLVLLGDPQQLTQVVQATHLGEVDESALGYFMARHPTIPASHGFFLERTWRMHPELNTIVSQLSYQGQLLSEEISTTARAISGHSPGLKMKKMAHHGFSSRNPIESKEVVNQVKALLQQSYSDQNPEAPEKRQMTQQDILVVSPFNAQVNLIKDTLKAEGLQEIEVGTVDKFQGRQAAAVIVSLAASDAQSAPRGLGFVLDRNRINVAISRAKVVCIMIYGNQLTGSKHRNIEDLQATSRLLTLEKLASA